MKERVADSVRLAGSISDLRSEKMECNAAVVALETENLLMKRLWDQVHYCRKLWKEELRKKYSFKLTDGSVEHLCSQIEQAFGFMKDAHAETRASKMIELISSSLLFTGAGVSILKGVHREFIWNGFWPWKLEYCSDMCPAGSFGTATVLGLTENFD